jgi:hypothetical protein
MHTYNNQGWRRINAYVNTLYYIKNTQIIQVQAMSPTYTRTTFVLNVQTRDIVKS